VVYGREKKCFKNETYQELNIKTTPTRIIELCSPVNISILRGLRDMRDV